MPAPAFISGPCKICAQPALGRHFGVLSCRACAAFFRRAESISKKARCEKGNCVVYRNGRYPCKSCRLKKCLEIGMDSRKFQTGRDLLSSTVSPPRLNTPRSLTNFLGRPEFILCCEPDKISSAKLTIDCSGLINKARLILLEGTVASMTPYQFDNSLEQLTFAMERMKSGKSNQVLKIVSNIEKGRLIQIWEENFLSAAYWFRQFSEFSELSMNVKIEIIKSVWMTWLRLEKFVETANYQKRQVLGSNTFKFADGSCLNIEASEVDVSWFTNYSLMVPDKQKYWRHPMELILNINPTNTELNFMLIQLCLSDAKSKAPPELCEVLDNILAVQADNLHDYYSRKVGLTHYSGRLAKMMKVVRTLEGDARIQREKVRLARVFDIFSIDFSHPEMFEIM